LIDSVFTGVGQKEMQTSRRSNDIWKQLSPQPDFLKKHLDISEYVLEGPVKMYDPLTREVKHRYLILSGPVVLICKQKGKKNLSWKDATGLTSRKDVTIVTDSTYSEPNVEFRIYGPHRTFIFFAPTVYDRDAWVRAMQQKMEASSL
jgi:hypothetical protein